MKGQRFVGNKATGEQIEVHLLSNGLAYSRVVKAERETSWIQCEVAVLDAMIVLAWGVACFLDATACVEV